MTSRLILVARTGSRYDPEKRHRVYRPQLLVVDLDAVSTSSSNPSPATLSEISYVCGFDYPPFVKESDVLNVTIRSDPGPGSCPSPMLGVPFSVSSEDRVFLVTLSVVVRPPEQLFLRHIVPASTFLRALGALAPGQVRREFAWNEWGPHGSRLMPVSEAFTTSETCFVYGTMVAFTEDDFSFRVGKSGRFVVLRDFNERAIRRRAEGRAGGGNQGMGIDDWNLDWRVVADATVFERCNVFKEEVTTALPYVERTFVPSQEETGGIRWDVMMLTEDALVMSANVSEARC